MTKDLVRDIMFGLRYKRIQAGIKQTSMARAISVKQSILHKWETGKGRPDIRKMHAYAMHVDSDLSEAKRLGRKHGFVNVKGSLNDVERAAFGWYCWKLRKESKTKAEDLARAVDISPSAISNIETGYCMASIQTLDRIARFFGLNDHRSMTSFPHPTASVMYIGTTQKDHILSNDKGEV